VIGFYSDMPIGRLATLRYPKMEALDMSTQAVVVVIAVAIAIVVACVLILRARKSQRLKDRFGPEYGRAVQQTGNRTQAEAKLEKIEKRVERYRLRPLSPQARANFVEEWRRVQARFVDDPRAALTEADKLIERIMAERGYPIAEFEERAADISVDHPNVVEHYRAGHEIAMRNAQGRASTEDMRLAMIHYRTLFDDLAELEPARSKTARV
jgi:hypothetical protein